MVYRENNPFIKIQITVTEAKHLNGKKKTFDLEDEKKPIYSQESAILTELVHCLFNILTYCCSFFFRGVDETRRKR